MVCPEKNTPSYLDTSINLHFDEKSWQLTDALSELTAPQLNVLEIGPGGGAALMGLADQEISRGGRNLHGVHFTLLELFPSQSATLLEASERLRAQGAFVRPVIADAAEMPLKAESQDIVNCSAVLHEIFSYSGGKQALTRALGELERVTRPGGRLLYRDVYPCDMSMQTPIEQSYERAAWTQFVTRFLPHFLEGDTQQYDPARVHLRKNGEAGMAGHMPAGLAREVQRHYITFRDHVIRSGILGLKIDPTRYDETDWVRTEAGFQKKIYIDQGSISAAEHPIALEEDRTGVYVPAAEFDDYIDEQLCGFFYAIASGRHEEDSVFQEWLKREGQESYVYGSTSEVIDMLRTAGTGNKERFVICRPEHYVVAERDYYSDYLNRVLGSCALPDRKLIVTFEKV